MDTNKKARKVLVVGSDETAYQFCFLSMVKLKMKRVHLFQVPVLEDEKDKDLQYSSSIFQIGSLLYGNEKDYSDTDILVLTAKEERQEGELDSEYLRRNILLTRKIINQAMENGFEGIVVVATDPSDLFTYLVWKFSGLPKNRIFGVGTYTDSAYFQKLLSDKLKISFRDVKGYIIGGSDPQHKTFAWSRSNAGGNSILGLTVNPESGFTQQDMFDIEEKIIERAQFNKENDTGYTSALALLKLVQFILTDEKAVVPLVNLIDIGDMKDIPLSLPVLLGSDGFRQSAGLSFSEAENKELLTIAKEISTRIDWIEKG